MLTRKKLSQLASSVIISLLALSVSISAFYMHYDTTLQQNDYIDIEAYFRHHDPSRHMPYWWSPEPMGRITTVPIRIFPHAGDQTWNNAKHQGIDFRKAILAQRACQKA